MLSGVPVVVLFLLLLSCVASLGALILAVVQAIHRPGPHLLNELSQSRRESADMARELRLELTSRLDALLQQLTVDAKSNRQESATSFSDLRASMERQLGQLRSENNQRLEDMRTTVAEKLEGTLERRLGASFKLVSDRLEQVHKGLGEMQSLATGVGDLKKVMVNVKSRGIWGEVMLGSLLDQILTTDQYSANVQTKANSNGRVEFAIKMPGRECADRCVWLPIDAKFPLESYHRLVEAQEQADIGNAEAAFKQLETFIKGSAKDIADKYLDPPSTTDFGVLYLPTEGLFAEVARRTGLVDQIQRDYRVVIAGPTTLAALLNSLQMGFRSLAIQKRSSEVWEILAAVKAEFIKFDDVLKKVEKKLQEAGNVIETVHSRSRVITRKLRQVQDVPDQKITSLLGMPNSEVADTDS
ncbi:MAG: DNA recombination protein RmuC [Deltaproteobacteria bacterium]|nr:DNA recombination protein RmuC [Deltaproteobacteria bacterium]